MTPFHFYSRNHEPGGNNGGDYEPGIITTSVSSGRGLNGNILDTNGTGLSPRGGRVTADNDPSQQEQQQQHGYHHGEDSDNRASSPFSTHFTNPFSASRSRDTPPPGAGGVPASSNIASQLRSANGSTNDNDNDNNNNNTNNQNNVPISNPENKPHPPPLSIPSALLSGPRSLSFAPPPPADLVCHSAVSAGGSGSTYPRRNISRRSRRSTMSSGGRSEASAFLSRWMSNGEDIPPAQPDDEGQIVANDYVIGRQIGLGGFSTVKEAHRVSADGATETMAVKIAKKATVTAESGGSEQENDRLQAELDHEIHIWRTLAHGNILPLEAVHETDYATFLFSPLVDGGTLFDLIKKNRNGLGLRAAQGYSFQIARALRYLHEDVHVVHRDIKLENCLLRFTKGDENSNDKNNIKKHCRRWPDGIGDKSDIVDDIGSLLLCDFGMAQWIMSQPVESEADKQVDLSGNANVPLLENAGSLEYASPEMLSSHTKQCASAYVSPAVDIWAFGVILFCLIVGSRPFSDSFAPRIQAAIISGEWDRGAILRAASSNSNSNGGGGGQEVDADTHTNVKNALDLIEGCLRILPSERLTIDQVLASEWFRGLSAEDEDDLIKPRTAWR